MEELFYKLEKQIKNLSELEQVVFKFMKSSPDTFLNGTLEQISGIIYVSTATISRTIKKLGFNSFQELRFIFQQKMQKNEKFENKSIEADYFKNIIFAHINETFSMLDSLLLNDIVEEINSSKNIEIYSVGASLALGIDLSRKLLSLGKKANAFIDWDDLSRNSKLQDASDLAILISLSGDTKHIIEYATNLKKNGVNMVAIVGTADSKLEELADKTLLAQTSMRYYKEADLSSRVSLTTLLEYMILKYSELLMRH